MASSARVRTIGSAFVKTAKTVSRSALECNPLCYGTKLSRSCASNCTKFGFQTARNCFRFPDFPSIWSRFQIAWKTATILLIISRTMITSDSGCFSKRGWLLPPEYTPASIGYYSWTELIRQSIAPQQKNSIPPLHSSTIALHNYSCIQSKP